jgi:hypothetical protein
MTVQLVVGVIVLSAVCVASARAQTSAAANPTAPPTQNAPASSPSRPKPSAADDRPTQVAPNTYHGAQGSKKDPGTACSTARLKKDGTLDCGMSGKPVTPKPPK